MDTPPSASVLGMITQRQFTLSDILSSAWEIYSKNFAAIAIITVLIILPINLISGAMTNGIESGDINSISWSSFGILGVLIALFGFINPLAITHLVQKQVEGVTVTYQEAIKAAFGKWSNGIVTSIILAFLLVILYVLLIIPGIIFTVFWAFAISAVMIDNVSGMQALSASKAAVKGRWWRVFGYFIVFGLITGLLSSVVTAIFNFSDSWIVTAVGSTISSILFAFSLVASVLLYINLKSVKAP
ncbi:MAG: hypothetical protein WC289_06240, partial [Patescibacteria group bacterium]